MDRKEYISKMKDIYTRYVILSTDYTNHGNPPNSTQSKMIKEIGDISIKLFYEGCDRILEENLTYEETAKKAHFYKAVIEASKSSSIDLFIGYNNSLIDMANVAYNPKEWNLEYDDNYMFRISHRDLMKKIFEYVDIGGYGNITRSNFMVALVNKG